MSDWGRPSNASTAPRRRGPGLLTMVIIFVLGAGLGSAGLLFLERSNQTQFADSILGNDSSEVDVLVQQNAELKRQLSQLSQNNGEAIDLQGILEEQETIIAGLREEVRTLKESPVDTSSQTPPNDETITELNNKIGQLEASLTLAGQVNSEMEGKLSEADKTASELQARLKLAEQLTDDLQSRLEAAEASTPPDAESSSAIDTADPAPEGKLLLAEQVNSDLEDRLKAADETAAEAESRLKLAEDSLDEAERQKAEAGERLNLAEQVNNELQTQLDRALNEDIPTLESDLAARDKTLASLDEEIQRLTVQIDKLSSTNLDDAGKIEAIRKSTSGQISSLNEELALTRLLAEETESENSKLRKDMARLKAENAELTASIDNSDKSPEITSPAKKTPQAEREPRDPLQVATAMQQAAGLSNLEIDQRDRIATRLIEGDCVGDTLREELGRVSAITLRDLIRAFDSDC
ncbi:MAG: hypothetical protein ACR2O0_04615 [Rhizobiaceae bacterium]